MSSSTSKSRFTHFMPALTRSAYNSCSWPTHLLLLTCSACYRNVCVCLPASYAVCNVQSKGRNHVCAHGASQRLACVPVSCVCVRVRALSLLCWFQSSWAVFFPLSLGSCVFQVIIWDVSHSSRRVSPAPQLARLTPGPSANGVRGLLSKRSDFPAPCGKCAQLFKCFPSVIWWWSMSAGRGA